MPSLWAGTLDEHRSLVLGSLLDAFGDLVRERGIEQTTLAAVAERAGIARSAVYNYVHDKHGLLLAHACRDIDIAAARLRERMGPDLPPADRLSRYVAASFEGFRSAAAAGDVMLALDREQQKTLLAHLEPVRELLAVLIADGLDDGTFAGGTAIELQEFVTAVIGGHRMLLARSDADSQALAARCTRLLLDGIGGGSEPTDPHT